MLSLSETISFIETKYTQTEIQLPCFNFGTLISDLLSQPKFLYRGESSFYPTTTSTFYRSSLQKLSYFNEINYFLTGLHLQTGQQINKYSLYYFLREALLNISIFEPIKDTYADLFICGLMQHYNFDTALIDLTSNINTAAHFACNGTVGQQGKILIIPTSKIENCYFDLTQAIGKRPKMQKSFVLIAPSGLDLKTQDFVDKYDAVWLPFVLTDEDQLRFSNTDILSTKDDEIVILINEWYNAHILHHGSITNETKSYLTINKPI